MSTILELTMHAKPGHFDQLNDAYTTMVETIEHDVADTRMILVVSDPTTGMLRGIGLYEHANVPEGFTNVPFFSNFMTAAEPHLTGPTERLEFDVHHIFFGEGAKVEGAQLTVAEITLHARFGEVDEVLAAYDDFLEYVKTNVSGTWVLLSSVDRGSGLVRGFGLYSDKATADSVMSLPASAAFAAAVEPLITSPLERVEHRVLHLFRGEGS